MVTATSYNKLWKLLIDRQISKADLRRMAGFSSNTLTKLSRGEVIAIPVLDKICDLLDVDYGDIMEHIKVENNSSN